MAYSNLTRNLRDGQIVIKDGTATPISTTLLLDTGDLSWTEKKNTIEVKDRGVLSHTRPGDQETVDISFSVKWTHLIQGSVTFSDGHMLYELFNELDSLYVSTSGDGEQYTLKIEFTVAAPAGVASTGEKIVFAKVYQESLQCGEGTDFNKIDFKGKDFETRPTISRV